MSAEDRVRWNKNYHQQATKPYPAPDPILFDHIPPADPTQNRRALDLAGGMGQNGLWLASQGYIVDVMDISRVALARAKDEMTARSLHNINLLQVDLDDVELEDNYYDVLCVFRYLNRGIIPRLRAAVKPGGCFIYQTFNVLYLEVVPNFNQDYLLSLGEIEHFFEGWRIIFLDEDDYNSQIVAQKPEKSA